MNPPRRRRDVWSALAVRHKVKDPNPATILLTLAPPIFKTFVPSIIRQLRLCNLMITIPFEWDGPRNRIRVLKSKRHLWMCQFQMILQIIYTLGMTGYFLSPRVQEGLKSSTRMVGLAFLVCFWTTMLTRCTFFDKRASIVQLINEYIKFEDKFLPGKILTVRIKKLAKLRFDDF